MAVPFFSARDVEAAVPPERAYEAVHAGFLAHARGEWTMQPKLYVTNYPAGDFRAMPALGGGHALLKWVTSFPGNPARGLPTVSGLVVLSDAETGLVEAVLDAGAVTALRTGAAAALAAETLGLAGAAAVVGAGVNGRAAARSLKARGRDVVLWDVDEERRRAVAAELGVGVAASRGGSARRPGRRHGHARPRDPAGGGLAARGPAREPDGRRRAREGRDRGRGDRAACGSSATSGSRRATAASSRRRSRPARSRART